MLKGAVAGVGAFTVPVQAAPETKGIASDAGWDPLSKKFSHDATPIRAFYLATGPDRFGAIAAQLAAYGLITPGSRIIVEKPIGKDSESAAKINDALGAGFHESQIYRIDP